MSPRQAFTRSFRIRTWPVFLVGIGSLLLLSFLPGIVVLWRTAKIYPEIRRIQSEHRESQRLLSEVVRKVYMVSVTVREALLDNSSASRVGYRSSFDEIRRGLQSDVVALRSLPELRGNHSVASLDRALSVYFEAIEPVFDWTPKQRNERALYFLREQQRPRRTSILAIAEEVNQLTETSYSRQLDRLSEGQVRFAADTRRVIAVALLIGGLISLLTIFRLVTLEERAEQQRVSMARAELELRTLSTQLMHAQEEERKTISRELHDEVGQILTGLRLGLGSLARARNDQPEFERQVDDMKSLAEQALRSVRDLAVGLRPSVLDLGLVPALQWQARRFATYSGVPVIFHAGDELADMPEDYRICVYRVVQECLTNAVKHSRARSIHVDLRISGGAIEVEVRDDGVGFAKRPEHNGGLGLLGMEERVRELAGSLKVESEPSAGTKVIVRLPRPEMAAKESA